MIKIVSSEILIHENLEKTFKQVEKVMRKTFNVTKGEELLHSEKIQFMGTGKDKIKMRQVVSEIEKNQIITFDSFFGQDKIVTTYRFRADGDEFTYVTLEENAYSSKTSRKYNYMLMTLPILRNGAMKKLKRQLSSLKIMIEGE